MTDQGRCFSLPLQQQVRISAVLVMEQGMMPRRQTGVEGLVEEEGSHHLFIPRR